MIHGYNKIGKNTGAICRGLSGFVSVFPRGEKVIRLLQSGFEKERQWERIEGEPQEWESEILGDREVAIGKMGIVSYEIQKIGVLFNLPGFGIPSTGEPWTIEIIN